MLALVQSANCIICPTDRPCRYAADVDALRVEWAVNLDTSMPDAAITVLNQRETVCELIGLYGGTVLMNNLVVPAASRSVLVLSIYSSVVETGSGPPTGPAFMVITLGGFPGRDVLDDLSANRSTVLLKSAYSRSRLASDEARFADANYSNMAHFSVS